MNFDDLLKDEVSQIMTEIEVIKTALSRYSSIPPEESNLKKPNKGQQSIALAVIASIEAGFLTNLKGSGPQGMRDFMNKSISADTYYHAVMELHNKLTANESILKESERVSDLMLVRLKTHIQNCIDIIETQNGTSQKSLLDNQRIKNSKPTFEKLLFTYSGRINQWTFILGIFLAYVISVLPNFLLGLIVYSLNLESVFGSPVSLLFHIVGLILIYACFVIFNWAHFCLIIKRAHDLNIPGIVPLLFLLLGLIFSFLYSFLIIVLFYIILMVAFSLIPSQSGENRFD